MRGLLNPSSNLLALFLFLPITPSIAAITVFTQSLLIDRVKDVSILPHDSRRIIKATRN